AGRSASPGAFSRGHALMHVRRLVSKYSAMPSHSTPSKSMARISGMAMASGTAFDGHVEQEGPPRGECLVEGGTQFVRRSDAGALHAHAPREIHEAEVGRRQVHVRIAAIGLGAEALAIGVHVVLEDPVLAVVQDEENHGEVVMRRRPQ